MYKILLVDDEINAINGLQVMIDFEKHQIDKVLTASNAFDALKIIKNERPEVIVTDISMPQMTGLAMIHEMKKVADYSPIIIVLSGYDTFSYAKEAMELGVRAYLLKPCDEDELNEKIGVFLEELSKNKETLEENNLSLAELNLLKLISGDTSGKTLAAFSQFLTEDDLSKFAFSLSLVSYKDNKDIELSDEEIESNYDRTYEIVTKVVASAAKVTFFTLKENEIAFVFESKNLDTQLVLQKMTNAQQIIASDLGIVLTSIISDPVGSFADINKIYNELKGTLLSRAFSNLPEVVLASEETVSSQEFSQVFAMFNELSNNFETMFEEEIKYKLHGIILKSKELGLPMSYFLSLFNAFMINITKFISETDRDVDSVISKLEDFKNQQQNYDEIESLVFEMVLKLYGDVSMQKSHQQNESFHTILTYVNNNYFENLTLKSLASKFYVNPIYLGRLFKKNTSTLFNEYLTQLRIQKSKTLLLKTNKKVYEIADAIGFNDPNYFIAKFLKIEGITPSQFRKKK